VPIPKKTDKKGKNHLKSSREYRRRRKIIKKGILINIERLAPNLDEIFAAGIENNACTRL